MLENIDNIDKHLINEIGKSFKKESFEYILNKYNMFDRNELIAILYLNGYNYEILKKYLYNVSIYDRKIMVISDTHVGSIRENLDYINLAYIYAYKNKIKSILHAGDLVQSTIRGVKKELINQDVQLEYLINNYPSYVNTYILLGNHDYKMNKKTDMVKILNSRPNINILGFKRAYINWCNYLISLSHPIDDYRVNLANISPLINLIGHRHEYNRNSNNIYIPTLSNDLKIYSNNPNYPGFIVLDRDKNIINVEHLSIIDDDIVDNGIVYQKKIEKRYKSF